MTVKLCDRGGNKEFLRVLMCICVLLGRTEQLKYHEQSSYKGDFHHLWLFFINIQWCDLEEVSQLSSALQSSDGNAALWRQSETSLLQSHWWGHLSVWDFLLVVCVEAEVKPAVKHWTHNSCKVWWQSNLKLYFVWKQPSASHFLSVMQMKPAFFFSS